MRLFMACVLAGMMFSATSHAQTEVLRGASTDSRAAAKPAAKQTAAQHQVQSTQQKQPTTPQSLRGSRYGGFAPSAPPQPPVLDTASARSMTLVNINTKETLTVTFWSNGAYRRDALDQLNHFLRDSQNNLQTEMDPLLFDVLWHTMSLVGYNGPVEVLSAFRSPATNAWLASMSRGVARDSQHMNGNAMDIRFPGVPVFKIRQAARSLQMGGVGFYPRSGFVHLDTGPVRYW
jgi:uncharacterized protein YcbK (DUF882 family)